MQNQVRLRHDLLLDAQGHTTVGVDRDGGSLALRSWLDSWRGISAVERGHGAPRVRPPAHRLRRTRLARHLLPDRVQPNHEKPINRLPTAPTTTPQAAGLNHGTCHCMTHLSACRTNSSSPKFA